VGNPYYFTSRQYDPETGLYYYRERHYSPIIGRFLQVDPLRIDDENPYTYCYNDPVNWVDPYGLQAVVPIVPPKEITPPTPIPGPKPGDNELPNGGQGSKEPGAVGAGAGAGEGVGAEAGANPAKPEKGKEKKPRTPAIGEPNSQQEFPDGKGGKTVRKYGPDGRATTDIDHGHDHGRGDPHEHDWDWSKPDPRN